MALNTDMRPHHSLAQGAGERGAIGGAGANGDRGEANVAWLGHHPVGLIAAALGVIVLRG